MRYTVIRRCFECDEPLLDRERLNSNGVCPHCGHVSNGTICKSYKEAGHWKFAGMRWFVIPRFRWIPIRAAARTAPRDEPQMGHIQ